MKPKNVLLDKIRAQAQKLKGESNKWDDPRVWTGKTGDVIRFLPSCADEEYPWSLHFSHGFQMSGQWFVAKCPQTVGHKCPVCELANALWATGYDHNRARAKRYMKRPNYTTNILVVKDQTNSENVGQVKLLKFGKQVFDLYAAALENEHPPYDPSYGRNFHLMIGVKNSFPNYEKCRFGQPISLYEGNQPQDVDAMLGEVYSLREFTHEPSFPNYQALVMKLREVVGDDMDWIVNGNVQEPPLAPAATPEPRVAIAPEVKAMAAPATVSAPTPGYEPWPLKNGAIAQNDDFDADQYFTDVRP